MGSDEFKEFEIAHKVVFDEFFQKDSPEISEFTFTNLFMWRHCYHPIWLRRHDCILIVFRPDKGTPYGLPPIGPGDKAEALETLCEEIGRLTPEARICPTSRHVSGGAVIGASGAWKRTSRPLTAAKSSARRRASVLKSFEPAAGGLKLCWNARNSATTAPARSVSSLSSASALSGSCALRERAAASRIWRAIAL